MTADEIETFIENDIIGHRKTQKIGAANSDYFNKTNQAKGTVLIHQKMFESRLFFVDKLIDMGAKVILCDPHRATVIGHNRQSQLKATKMTSPDIRAGISLLIAALSAKGTSIINNIEQIDRGYEDIDIRLRYFGR